MLSAEADSFRLKSRLAISLSWIAGFTNVVTLVTTGHVISHVTGNVTILGHGIGAWNAGPIWFATTLVMAFFAGAVISAVLTEVAREHSPRLQYALPVAAEAVLLTFVALCVASLPDGGLADLRMQYIIGAAASAAMGIQNATITRISGAVVRTTHLTGVVTDLGLESVQYLVWRIKGSGAADNTEPHSGPHWRHPKLLRLVLLVSIAGSFLLGAIIGTVAVMRWQDRAMWAPVMFLAWMVFETWRKAVASRLRG